MTDVLDFQPVRILDANADPVPNAEVRFYESGTTTPYIVYADSGLTNPHDTPLVANSEGVFPEVFASGTIRVKAVIKTSAGVTLHTLDPVFSSPAGSAGASSVSFTPITGNTATDAQTAIANNTAQVLSFEEQLDNATTVTLSTGTGAAFTLAAPNTITAYSVGQLFLVRWHTPPTGACTINIDSVGGWNLKKYNGAGTLVDIEANDWPQDGENMLYNDGTQFVVFGPLQATATAPGVAALLDEDDMTSDSAISAASQQSVKAYTDLKVKLTEGTMQATTSGSAFDFTGIPAGTKEILVVFSDVSLNGTDDLLVQIGDAGGPELTGYVSASNTSLGGTASTVGFLIRVGAAGAQVSGVLHLYLMDAATNLWASSHGATITASSAAPSGGGAKALSAELTQVRFTRDASNTFDAGSVNILYR